MKILVLENDPNEFAIIQQAFNDGKTSLIPIASSEQAWPYIQSGEARFVIANWDTSDVRRSQFILRARAIKLTQPLYILLTMAKITDDDQTPSGADDILQRPFRAKDLKNRVGMAERIISLASNLAVAREQLEHQAVFDSLTGFLNRAAFFKQAMGELERARRTSMPVSLIALDVDHFKVINDSLGRDIGDQVLHVVAQAIREKSRPYDCIGRESGDFCPRFRRFAGGLFRIGVKRRRRVRRATGGCAGSRCRDGRAVSDGERSA